MKLKDSLGHSDPNILRSMILLQPASLNPGSGYKCRLLNPTPDLLKDPYGQRLEMCIQNKCTIIPVRTGASGVRATYPSSPTPHLSRGSQGVSTGRLRCLSRTRLPAGHFQWDIPGGPKACSLFPRDCQLPCSFIFTLCCPAWKQPCSLPLVSCQVVLFCSGKSFHSAAKIMSQAHPSVCCHSLCSKSMCSNLG